MFELIRPKNAVTYRAISDKKLSSHKTLLCYVKIIYCIDIKKRDLLFMCALQKFRLNLLITFFNKEKYPRSYIKYNLKQHTNEMIVERIIN